MARTAFITGAGKGIGAAIALALAEAGHRVALAARTAADLEQAKASIQRAHKVQVTCHVRDLAQHAECVALARACADVDILINNAGAIPGGSLRNLDDTAWRKGWELKVFGYISLTREIYTRMCERKSGTIINVIGSAGERPNAGYIAGTTANAGLMAFTRALGAEAPDNGIRVVGVNPGKTATERQINLARDAAREKFGDANRYPEILKLVKKVHDEGGIVASICHGPWVLISAKIVRGRRLTCVSAIKDDVMNAGAEYLDEEVVVDRNIVTSRTPKDIAAWSRAIVDLLQARRDGGGR